VNSESVPSRLSTISTMRDCWPQSMQLGVLISQKPPPSVVEVALWGTIVLAWVWPLHQATTFGNRSSKSTSSAPVWSLVVSPGAAAVFSIVQLVWWLRMTMSWSSTRCSMT
jgi:hypothetical protein